MPAEEIQVKVGSIILATGYDLMDPSPMRQFGYGRYPNVFTSLEFERLSNATGPTSGQLLIRDENGRFARPPESVAILHCVGSRDVNYHEYCSRVCCMVALKYTHLIKEKVGHHTRVYDFYIDQRCYGKGYEEFLPPLPGGGHCLHPGQGRRDHGPARIRRRSGQATAIAEDTLSGTRLRLPVDMVVLCAAMESREDTAAVGRIFGVNQGADGFFLEEHPKLGPLNTATDGVFLAGACQGPKDIPDAVAQASGQRPSRWRSPVGERSSSPRRSPGSTPTSVPAVRPASGSAPTRPSSSTRGGRSRSSTRRCARAVGAAPADAPAVRPRCGISRRFRSLPSTMAS